MHRFSAYLGEWWIGGATVSACGMARWPFNFFLCLIILNYEDVGLIVRAISFQDF